MREFQQKAAPNRPSHEGSKALIRESQQPGKKLQAMSQPTAVFFEKLVVLPGGAPKRGEFLRHSESIFGDYGFRLLGDKNQSSMLSRKLQRQPRASDHIAQVDRRVIRVLRFQYV
jgi:hypothetical protein